MAMALLMGEALEALTPEERWQSDLSRLSSAPIIWPCSQEFQQAIIRSQTPGTNSGNPLLSLPVDILLEVLEYVGPLTMYNVALTCKSLTIFILSQPTLLYPNPRQTTSLSRFEGRWDFVRGCFSDGLLPLYTTYIFNRVPLTRRVHFPRVSNIHVRTGCYRCDLTSGSPNFTDHQVGSRRWLEHLREELARRNTPCTRGIASFVAIEFALWFGQLLASNGGTPRPRRNLTVARRELLLDQSRARFRVWVRDVQEQICDIIRGG